MNEEERIRKIIVDMAKGDDTGHKLEYDRSSKRIMPVSKNGDPDGTMKITPKDAELFATKKGSAK